MPNETERAMQEAEKALKEQRTKKQAPPTNRLEDFPPATENGETGKTVAHNGLTAEERETAKRLGYDLRDVRFITGRLGAELTMLGVRQRTVDLDDAQIRVVLKEIEAYGKADSAIGEGKKDEKGVGEEVSSWFSGLGTGSTGVGAGMDRGSGSVGSNPQPAPSIQPKKRGRPAGSKDRKPRAIRGSAISRESQKAMEEAIKAMEHEG